MFGSKIFKIIEQSDITSQEQKDKMRKIKNLKFESIELEKGSKLKNEDYSLSYHYLKIQVKNYIKDGKEQTMI